MAVRAVSGHGVGLSGHEMSSLNGHGLSSLNGHGQGMTLSGQGMKQTSNGQGLKQTSNKHMTNQSDEHLTNQPLSDHSTHQPSNEQPDHFLPADTPHETTIESILKKPSQSPRELQETAANIVSKYCNSPLCSNKHATNTLETPSHPSSSHR